MFVGEQGEQGLGPVRRCPGVLIFKDVGLKVILKDVQASSSGTLVCSGATVRNDAMLTRYVDVKAV